MKIKFYWSGEKLNDPFLQFLGGVVVACIGILVVSVVAGFFI